MTEKNGDHKEESLIQFPTDFTVKIMGKKEGDFEKIVTAIIQQHFPDYNIHHMQKKLSKDGNFLSLSVTVYVESKEALDDFYRELSSTKEVLMAL